jgi:hypothetical protein
VDAVDFIKNVPQQVAVEHAVDGPLEDGSNHVATIAAVGVGNNGIVPKNNNGGTLLF